MGDCITCNVVVEMTWEEFKVEKNFQQNTGLEKTDIECPRCGEKIYKDTRFILTTYPPKNRYVCMECFWEGTA